MRFLWLLVLEERDQEFCEELNIKMAVDVGQDGKVGRISFHGVGGDSVGFDAMLHVEYTSAGTRVMNQSGSSYSGSKTMKFSNILHESEISAQDAFKEYNLDYENTVEYTSDAGLSGEDVESEHYAEDDYGKNSTEDDYSEEDYKNIDGFHEFRQ